MSKPAQWTSLPAAAEALGLHVLTLRRAVERNARKAPDGAVEANFDGVRARKFGRCWRVSVGAGWTTPPKA